MERTYINEAQKAIGGTVKVQGFIENLRNSKYMAFIVLKDITGKLQITVEKEDHPDLVDTIDKLTPDSVITVTGKVVENDYVKMGGVEMIPESIEIESIADALPIVRKEIAATKKNTSGTAEKDSFFRQCHRKTAFQFDPSTFQCSGAAKSLVSPSSVYIRQRALPLSSGQAHRVRPVSSSWAVQLAGLATGTAWPGRMNSRTSSSAQRT